MAMLTRREVEQLVFQKPNLCGIQRFTQDSPVLPDVWFAYAEPFLPAKEAKHRQGKRGKNAPPLRPGGAVDLLLNPHRDGSAMSVYRAIKEQLPKRRPRAGEPYDLTYNESFVVVRLRFDELVRIVLPMTDWWRKEIRRGEEKGGLNLSRLVQALNDADRGSSAGQSKVCKTHPHAPSADLVWLARIVGRLAWEERQAGRGAAGRKRKPSNRAVVKAFLDLLRESCESAASARLWSVNLNRPVGMAVRDSVMSMKADAAWRLFDLKTEGIRWAIIDGGIDATHPAFRRRYLPQSPGTPSAQKSARAGKRTRRQPKAGQSYRQPFELDRGTGRYENRTRIVATYDFTQLRRLLCINSVDDRPGGKQFEKSQAYRNLDPEAKERVQDYRDGLESGRMIDWQAIAPLLRVPHQRHKYDPPRQPHGTHVAGILAADWHAGDDPEPPYGPNHDDTRPDLHGMCPDLELYDFRVLGPDGEGYEYSILAALQFIRWLNANKDEPVVHGVNISLSLPHDVANFACGQTPVCEECERLMNSGVIVVVAAGNEGQAQFNTPDGQITTGYRGISITDPGNAEAVITVGATHRFKPHTYGVSYFSSRGPTGDGRCKPDLVAPGEKIISCIPGGQAGEMDGTSMAAPHVSGAAALLLARHRELMSRPARVKQILCETATDLGRERFFQGHGMVDVLRAIQSI